MAGKDVGRPEAAIVQRDGDESDGVAPSVTTGIMNARAGHKEPSGSLQARRPSWTQG